MAVSELLLVSRHDYNIVHKQMHVGETCFLHKQLHILSLMFYINLFFDVCLLIVKCLRWLFYSTTGVSITKAYCTKFPLTIHNLGE